MTTNLPQTHFSHAKPLMDVLYSKEQSLDEGNNQVIFLKTTEVEEDEEEQQSKQSPCS